VTTEQLTQPQTHVSSAGYGTVLQDDWPRLHPMAELLRAISDPRLRALFGHWLAARGDAAMPAWKDIDPLALGPLLPHIWSLPYDRGDDSFTGRLSGEEINAIFGKSLRQTRIENFFAPADVPWIHERCLRIIAQPCIALVNGPVYGYTGRYGRGSRIMLPLGEDRATGDEVIGATVYSMHPPGTAVSELLAVESVTYYAL
jgi:hypothetical protein